MNTIWDLNVARNVIVVMLKQSTAQQILANTVFYVKMERSTWIMRMMQISVGDVIHVTTCLKFILGFESTKNCTPEQNTECTCAKNHFCISEQCSHCDPCSVCESGVVEKPCTSTSDTVCGIKDKRKQKGHTKKEDLGEVVTKPEVSYHSFSFMLLDVDLSNHIARIVEEMTLQEVRMFVRNHKVPEPVIDQTVRDYPTDTSEQKIKLFQVWYQRHGIKGAYGSLINSLREFKMCAAADKIEEKLKATVASYQEGAQSRSDDTEQSKTCTQESRNSYKGSAALHKTYSDSSEEIQNRVI
ncbi:tumor necrosis factor receptor superfamily member 6 isoform 2-T2 [Porphyrio hochstetteri]